MDKSPASKKPKSKPRIAFRSAREPSRARSGLRTLDGEDRSGIIRVRERGKPPPVPQGMGAPDPRPTVESISWEASLPDYSGYGGAYFPLGHQ